MDIDTSIGSVGDEFPEILNVLVDRTGFNPEHVAIWDVVLETGYWNKSGALPVFPGLSDVVSPSPDHDFAASVLSSAAYLDSNGSTAYAYATGSQGALLGADAELFLWRDGRWWSAPWPVSVVSGSHVAQSIGDLEGVVIGMTGPVDVADLWEIGTSDLLASHDAQEWLSENLELELADDDVLEVPGVARGVGLFLVSSWGLPTFGPPAPDPASAYHRLRITALRLSTLGIDVTIDWGPFEQTYAADAVGADFACSVFISTMSADYFTTGGGILRNIALTGSDQDSVNLAGATLRAFGFGD
jgi:hypothetical protein